MREGFKIWGERIREAREIRGFPVNGFADSLEVSRQSVYLFENNKKNPSIETLEKISKLLNFPISFFSLEPEVNKSDLQVYFRSLSSASQAERKRLKYFIRWQANIVKYLQEYLEFVASDIPDFGIKFPEKLKMEEVEAIAAEARKYWGMSNNPLRNPTLFFESKGVLISRLAFDSDKMDASSTCIDDTLFVMLNSQTSAFRNNFNLCHEIGHKILHNNLDKNKIENLKSFKLIEAQAHRFASAFLLPADTFLGDLYIPSLDAFYMLKEKWKVSIAMMIKRCSDLEIIDEEKTTRLWINLGKRGWRTEEPLDKSTPADQPVFLNRCIDLLIKNKVLCKDDIVNAFPYPRQNIEELLNLPNNFLLEKDAEILPMPLVKKITPHNEKNGVIVPFKKD